MLERDIWGLSQISNDSRGFKPVSAGSNETSWKTHSWRDYIFLNVLDEETVNLFLKKSLNFTRKSPESMLSKKKII